MFQIFIKAWHELAFIVSYSKHFNTWPTDVINNFFLFAFYFIYLFYFLFLLSLRSFIDSNIYKFYLHYLIIKKINSHDCKERKVYIDIIKIIVNFFTFLN